VAGCSRPRNAPASAETPPDFKRLEQSKEREISLLPFHRQIYIYRSHRSVRDGLDRAYRNFAENFAKDRRCPFLMESNDASAVSGDVDANNANDERTAGRVMNVSRGAFAVY